MDQARKVNRGLRPDTRTARMCGCWWWRSSTPQRSPRSARRDHRRAICRWLRPVSGDLVLGGRCQVEGDAGGTVRRCAEPALSRSPGSSPVASPGWWSRSPRTARAPGSASGTGARRRGRRERVRTRRGRHRLGDGLGGLRLHLTDPAAPRPDPDYTDPGYPAFVRASGAAWAGADAAAGTDPEQANAAPSAASPPTPRCRPTRASDARLRRPRRPGPAPDPRAAGRAASGRRARWSR